MESGLNKGVLINTALFDDKVGCYKIVNEARKVRKQLILLGGRDMMIILSNQPGRPKRPNRQIIFILFYKIIILSHPPYRT